MAWKRGEKQRRYSFKAPLPPKTVDYRILKKTKYGVCVSREDLTRTRRALRAAGIEENRSWRVVGVGSIKNFRLLRMAGQNWRSKHLWTKGK